MCVKGWQALRATGVPMSTLARAGPEGSGLIPNMGNGDGTLKPLVGATAARDCRLPLCFGFESGLRPFGPWAQCSRGCIPFPFEGPVRQVPSYTPYPPQCPVSSCCRQNLRTGHVFVERPVGQGFKRINGDQPKEVPKRKPSKPPKEYQAPDCTQYKRFMNQVLNAADGDVCISPPPPP